MSIAQEYCDLLTSWEPWAHDAMCRIEREHGLYGYPPELVSVGLCAVDRGYCPEQAIAEYLAAPTPEAQDGRTET